MKPTMIPLLLATCGLVACSTPSKSRRQSYERIAIEQAIRQHEQLAWRAQAADDLPRAVTHWQILTLLAPTHPDYQTKREQAEAAIPVAIARWLQLGQQAQRKGQLDEAASAMLRILVTDPNHAVALATLRDIERQRSIRTQAARAAKFRQPMQPSTGDLSPD
ncbi:hypothetical protein [Chitinivorax sp. B]|uniref:hypothetical protein n=1 Tax=Chitinivorax sp. B TaxID=2502235 RepID=UPI0010F65C26|nr:hypothetical protein [Chitinivorax sp. B]